MLSLNITLYLCFNVCNVAVEAIPQTTNLVEMRVIDDKTLINLNVCLNSCVMLLF